MLWFHACCRLHLCQRVGKCTRPLFRPGLELHVRLRCLQRISRHKHQQLQTLQFELLLLGYMLPRNSCRRQRDRYQLHGMLHMPLWLEHDRRMCDRQRSVQGKRHGVLAAATTTATIAPAAKPAAAVAATTKPAAKPAAAVAATVAATTKPAGVSGHH